MCSILCGLHFVSYFSLFTERNPKHPYNNGDDPSSPPPTTANPNANPNPLPPIPIHLSSKPPIPLRKRFPQQLDPSHRPQTGPGQARAPEARVREEGEGLSQGVHRGGGVGEDREAAQGRGQEGGYEDRQRGAEGGEGRVEEGEGGGEGGRGGGVQANPSMSLWAFTCCRIFFLGHAIFGYCILGCVSASYIIGLRANDNG